ncbi:CDP-diacylglycerol--serine O-phosphatidyltransferase [Cucumispora dikerogammari]|nr:CDP-diacylglycerol--serine O-phosphatidyltransferase [Cucumispora dikerogammari]
MFTKLFDSDFSKALLHRYNACNLSITYNRFTRPIMEAIVEYLPRTLAPNIITLTGFVFMLINLRCIHLFSPNIRNLKKKLISAKEKPKHNILLNLISAACLFIYWMLDNLDGHQARRTKSGTPLGFFTDHSIDSFNNSIICVAFYASTNIYNPKLFFISLIMCNTAFFLTTLENKLSGCFNLWYFSFPDDGLILLIILHLFLITDRFRKLFEYVFSEKFLYVLSLIMGVCFMCPIVKQFKLHAVFELAFFVLLTLFAYLVFQRYKDFYIYSFSCSSFIMSLLVSFICREYKLLPIGFSGLLSLIFLYFSDVGANEILLLRFISGLEMVIFFGMSVNRFERALETNFFKIKG